MKEFTPTFSTRIPLVETDERAHGEGGEDGEGNPDQAGRRNDDEGAERRSRTDRNVEITRDENDRLEDGEDGEGCRLLQDVSDVLGTQIEGLAVDHSRQAQEREKHDQGVDNTVVGDVVSQHPPRIGVRRTGAPRFHIVALVAAVARGHRRFARPARRHSRFVVRRGHLCLRWRGSRARPRWCPPRGEWRPSSRSARPRSYRIRRGAPPARPSA